jgi:hypothetical protein
MAQRFWYQVGSETLYRIRVFFVPMVGIEPTTRGFSVPVPRGVTARKETGKERNLKVV